MPRPLSGALAVLVLVGFASTARAAGERVALHWDGPESCPENSFRAAIDRYLGPRVGDGPPLSVRVRVRERAPGRWSLDLDAATTATTGTRHLEAERCETVLDAAAFVVAQAIAATSGEPAPREGESPREDESPAAAAERDHALVPEPRAVEPSPSSLPVAASGSLAGAEAPPGPSDAAEAPPRSGPLAGDDSGPTPAGGVAPVALRPPRLRVALRVAGGVSGGALPTVGGDLGLAVALLGARWRAEVVGHGRLPARVRAPADPAVGADLSLWAIGLRGCAVPRISRPAPSLRTVEFPLCAGAEVGQAIGRSVGLATRGRAGVVWAAITAAPGVMWVPRPWLAVGLQVELAVTLLRHEFVIRGLPPLHGLGPVDVRGVVGVEFRLARGGARRASVRGRGS
ncbi:hypothetical protein [Nannocystis sp. SCPEA4]|uniref:hypothetical protein n=1 Tax=Nannocystis sp. SCPEA4 TaxID=2996787 RepID=UPI00226F46FD|nr:hypothetical protein [Nannocystis sp. SCPEA4]MCY1059336.1 hypothetical protein [Nannocystis sp. SCPEA4]